MEGRSVAAVAPDFFAKSTREFAILDDSGFLQTFKPPWATDSFGEGREGGGREKCRRPNLIVKGRGEWVVRKVFAKGTGKLNFARTARTD